MWLPALSMCTGISTGNFIRRSCRRVRGSPPRWAATAGTAPRIWMDFSGIRKDRDFRSTRRYWWGMGSLCGRRREPQTAMQRPTGGRLRRWCPWRKRHCGREPAGSPSGLTMCRGVPSRRWKPCVSWRRDTAGSARCTPGS